MTTIHIDPATGNRWLSMEDVIRAVTSVDRSARYWQSEEGEPRGLVLTASRILTDAKALLIKDGWIQGAYETGEGLHCSVGAVIGAIRAHGLLTRTLEITPLVANVYFYLSKAIGTDERIVSGTSRGRVIDFNDACGTTFEDVLDIFTHAIKFAQEDEAA